MSSRIHSVLVFCLLLFLFPTAPVFGQQAQEQSLQLAGIFGNNMVLQQKSDAAIWGVAKPGQRVTVETTWSKKVAKTKADADGKWKTTIETPTAGGPYAVNVKTNDSNKQLKNVLIGEVWICSGQSNMQWKLRGFGVKHFEEDVRKANHPTIRFCYVPQILALQPQDDVKTRWSECNPKSALSFSAVAYFFGDRLREELNVPIGLISTNWGGSSAEAWVSPTHLRSKFPEFNEKLDGYDGWIQEMGVIPNKEQKKEKKINHRMPSVLHNQMIRPLVPFSFRGVVWYQGETNVENPVQYRELFPELIQSWRQEWGQGEFPFYFVQIAPYHYRTKEMPAALLREAQFQTLKVPNTGMVVTMDIGDPTNIHPKRKKPVGERLALLALANTYGKKNVVYSGPQYVGHKIESKRIRLNFEHVGGGLATRDGNDLSHFTVAGKDKTFYPADAKIDGDTIVVRSSQVARPIAVRYGWGNADEPNLMNKEGLPSSSFRTDDWEIVPSKPTKKRGRR